MNELSCFALNCILFQDSAKWAWFQIIGTGTIANGQFQHQWVSQPEGVPRQTLKETRG